MFKNLLFIAIGGSLGAVLRYIISINFIKYIPLKPHWATLLINAIGCFLIGIGVGYFNKTSGIDTTYKLLFITGFCGSFTTFSTFGLENIQLIQQNQITNAVLYIILSVIIGLLCVLAGLYTIK